MGEVVFLKNVGTSDVRVRSWNVTKCAREMGERIWQAFDKLKEEIELPLMEPTFDELRQCGIDKIDCMVLFVTNQEDGNPQDTIYYGKIINRLLKGEGWAKTKWGIEIGDVILKEIRDNPADYGKMMEWFKQHLQRYSGEMAGDVRVIVELTGGTPATCMALLFYSVYFMGELVEAVYVYRRDDVGRALCMPIGKELHKALLVKMCLALLENYNFAGVRDMCEKMGDEAGEKFAEYLWRRSMLDVKGGRDAIEGWMRAGYRSEREFEVIEELENIGTTSGRVRELYWNMWVQMQRGELTEWLERFMSIRDVFYQWYFEKEYNLKADGDWRDVWREFVESRGLIERAHAAEEEIRVEEPTSKSYEFVLKELGREEILSYWRKYEKVFGLRNKWVHEGKGVSERAIREGCGMNVREIMDDLREFIEKCGIELGDNPWEKDTKILKEHIAR